MNVQNIQFVKIYLKMFFKIIMGTFHLECSVNIPKQVVTFFKLLNEFPTKICQEKALNSNNVFARTR